MVPRIVSCPASSLPLSTMPLDAASIKKYADLYPKPKNIQFHYGTAGFRTLYVNERADRGRLINSHNRGSILDSVLFRVGVIAGLRSKKLDGKTIGVMITASHNPEPVSTAPPISMNTQSAHCSIGP